MSSTGTRSWAHMIYDVGSTISMEAWDASYKGNLDLSSSTAGVSGVARKIVTSCSTKSVRAHTASA